MVSAATDRGETGALQRQRFLVPVFVNNSHDTHNSNEVAFSFLVEAHELLIHKGIYQ